VCQMKFKKWIGWSSALCLSACALQAQETNSNEQFNETLKRMQENFERQQREMRESFEKMFREQQKEIEALRQQVAARSNAAPAAAASAPAPEAGQPPWSPAQPIR